MVLTITLGSFVAAGMPLLNALLGVGVSIALIFLATVLGPVTATTPLLALMLGLAVGIDYALFIVARHQQELANGASPQEAAARATATAGSAVIFAGLTVMIALVGLGVAGIPFLLAALTLAPIINDRFNTDENYGTIQKVALVIVLSIFGWMGTARLIRGEVITLREREFVQAARVMGMPTSRILFRELLPNLAAPIIISVSVMLPTFVALEAGHGPVARGTRP